MSRRRGSVFVLALIVITAATTILALTVSTQRVYTQSSINRLEARRARLAAESGLQRALAELALVTDTNVLDQTGTWFTLGNNGDDKFVVGADSFRLQVVDAGAFLNLNTLTELQLQNLNLTQSQIDSLLDWREAGDQARTEGAKNDYYNSLEKPYNAREARLESLDEVLLVKDWLPSTLYDIPDTTANGLSEPLSLYQLLTVDSFSSNNSATGQAKQNLNNVQAQQLIQAGISQASAQAIIARRNGLGQFTSINQVFTTPGLDTRAAEILLNSFGVGNAQRVEGRVNLNTASEDVLSQLTDVTSDIAQAIVARQSTGFANLGEVTQIPGVTVQLLGQIADKLTISGDTFLVRCEGSAGQTKVAIEAVVQIEDGAPRVMKILDAPQSNMVSLWRWSDDSTGEVVLGEGAR